MPPKSLLRTGLVILAISIVLPLGTVYWLKTRKFQPVDMPVSLLAGQIQTIKFETNLSGDYFVNFDFDYEIYDRAVEPCSVYAWRGLDWALYRLDGGVTTERVLWATNNHFPEDGFWGGFHGPPGKYQLDWKISAEGECLNSGHPHLNITYLRMHINRLIISSGFSQFCSGERESC